MDALLSRGREVKNDLGRAIWQIDSIVEHGMPDWLLCSVVHRGYHIYRIYVGRIVVVFGVMHNRLAIACVREFTTTHHADTALNDAKHRLEKI